MSKINLMDKIPGCDYFTWSEALYLPQYKVHHEPSDGEMQAIIALAKKMNEVRKHFGIPFKINVWIRPTSVKSMGDPQYNGRDYNKLIGGAAGSAHVAGAAVDFMPDGMTVDEFLAKLEPLCPKFCLSGERNGSVVGRNWIHLENRQKKGQWRLFNP